MRGSLRQRSKGSWSIILDRGWQTDPATGLRRRKQQWLTLRGTKKDAELKLAELLASVGQGTYVEPSKLTLGAWLREWLAKTVTPAKAPGTVTRYRGIVESYLIPRLGDLRLQAVRPGDLEAYYATLGQSPASTQTHHIVLSAAFAAAVRASLIPRNPAAWVQHKPRAPQGHDHRAANVWSAGQARAFLTAAQAAGPQPAAFYALALETGLRKGELCGLKWEDVDLERGSLSVLRTLLTPGPRPVFGPPKTKRPRTLDLDAGTVRLLVAHKAAQAAVKLKHRTTYHDHGLVFAKDWADMTRAHDVLGDPLQLNSLGERQFTRLMKAAGVPRITFHGLRHTSATLALQAGIPAHVVQRRLGHARIEMTLNIYAHVLPAQGQDAAAVLGGVLYGR